MIDQGREALIAAALRGQPQAHGKQQVNPDAGPDDPLCAMQVLKRAFGATTLWEVAEAAGLHEKVPEGCQECGWFKNCGEAVLLVHLNDFHGYDFLTIARKMPVSDESPDESPIDDDPGDLPDVPPMPLLLRLLVEQNEPQSQEPRQESFDFGG